MVVRISFQESDFVKWIIALVQFVGEEMPFRKRIAREKTLLQKSFPPGPPFRKLPYVCGVDMGQPEVGSAAHKPS